MSLAVWGLQANELLIMVMCVQEGTQVAATKRSAADAAAQEGVDDMLEEQDGEGEADEAPEEAADEAEEDLDDTGAESA